MNNIFKLFFLGAAMTFSLSSCNDWLDVRPDTEQKEQDQFSTEKGFQTALTGCYMEMASTDAYGLRLSMTNIENLANLWLVDDATSRYGDEYLSKHDYTNDYAKSAIQAFYTSLFKSVAQANLIIKHAEGNPGAISDKQMRDVILGEAYAIRAYCQFDVLRLFGQMPQNAQKQVKLPYSETTSIDQLPAYYSYADYVAKLKADMDKAAALLKESDPAMTYKFKDMHSKNESKVNKDFLLYRQMRLNYWAVRALQARMALYVGETQSANSIANELINAKLADGTAVRPLSGKEDFTAGYTTCPNECYFSLSKYDVKTVAASYFTLNDDEARYRSGSHFVLTTAMLGELFAGENLEAHNRYNNLWNQRLPNPSNKLYCGYKRYCFADGVTSPSLYYQVIPMLRTSEMFLIAMETSKNLAEVNALYKTYMISHNVVTAEDRFQSLDEVKEWIENEYRREFYGEGQMFYTYKRLGEKAIKWLKTPADEALYVLPLPETEFEPNA